MKKAICIILFLCTAMVFSGVQTGLAYRNYDGGCGACHESGSGTVVHDDHGAFSGGLDCSACHAESPPESPATSTCAECHPWPGPGLCPIVDIHSPFSASCTACHARDCETPSECELVIRHRKIRSEKLRKDRRLVLHITGSEGFDPFGERDLGPLTTKKVFFRKNKLKAVTTLPAGLEPQIIPIRVGNCLGVIRIQ
jgi:hypothetical protein